MERRREVASAHFLTVRGTGKQQMQVALVGRESLIGSPVLLHGVPAYRAVVQFEGATWRVPADVLVHALENNIDLQRQLLRGVNAFQPPLPHGFSQWQGDDRATSSRWLLAAADRRDTDRLVITHDTLSRVSKANHAIEVVDRKELERIAGFDGRYLQP